MYILLVILIGITGNLTITAIYDIFRISCENIPYTFTFSVSIPTALNLYNDKYSECRFERGARKWAKIGHQLGESVSNKFGTKRLFQRLNKTDSKFLNKNYKFHFTRPPNCAHTRNMPNDIVILHLVSFSIIWNIRSGFSDSSAMTNLERVLATST